jgi:hypothetical protein
MNNKFVRGNGGDMDNTYQEGHEDFIAPEEQDHGT